MSRTKIASTSPGAPTRIKGGPPIKGLVQPAAKQGTEHAPRGNAQRVDGKRRRPAPFGEEVGNHRVRRRATAGLTNRDADAGEQQMPEIAGKSAQHGHSAPHRQTDRDHVAAHGDIRKTRHGNADEGVEDGKSHPTQKTHLGVGKTEILLDRLIQHAEDGAVDEVEDVNDEEQTERIPGAPTDPLLARCGVTCGHLTSPLPVLCKSEWILTHIPRGHNRPVTRTAKRCLERRDHFESAGEALDAVHRHPG